MVSGQLVFGFDSRKGFLASKGFLGRLPCRRRNNGTGSSSTSAIGVFIERSFRCVLGRNRSGSFSSDDYRTLKVCQASALASTAIAGGEAALMTLSRLDSQHDENHNRRSRLLLE
jgi:hypothetical protein